MEEYKKRMAEKKKKEKEDKLNNPTNNNEINNSINPQEMDKQDSFSSQGQEPSNTVPQSQLGNNTNNIMSDIYNDNKCNLNDGTDLSQFRRQEQGGQSGASQQGNQFINRLDRNEGYVNNPHYFQNHQADYEFKRVEPDGRDPRPDLNPQFNPQDPNAHLSGSMRNQLMGNQEYVRNLLNYKRNMESGTVFRTQEEVSEFFNHDQHMTDEQCRNFKIGPWAEEEHFSQTMPQQPQTQGRQNPPSDLQRHNLETHPEELGLRGTREAPELVGHEPDPQKNDLEKAMTESLDHDAELQKAIQESLLANTIHQPKDNNLTQPEPNFEFMTEEEQLAQIMEMSKDIK